MLVERCDVKGGSAVGRGGGLKLGKAVGQSWGAGGDGRGQWIRRGGGERLRRY